jgi:steroid delta-isomerase-like uncharacterized protein
LSNVQANVDVCVRANQEVFGAGRLELADELFAPDFVDHEGIPGIPPGPAGPKAIAAMIHAGTDDVRYEIEDAFGAGDRVALRATMHARHTGDLFGVPATGRTFTLRQMHVFRVVDGRITDHWPMRDDLGMLRQLGAVPAAPGAPA